MHNSWGQVANIFGAWSKSTFHLHFFQWLFWKDFNFVWCFKRIKFCIYIPLTICKTYWSNSLPNRYCNLRSWEMSSQQFIIPKLHQRAVVKPSFYWPTDLQQDPVWVTVCQISSTSICQTLNNLLKTFIKDGISLTLKSYLWLHQILKLLQLR